MAMKSLLVIEGFSSFKEKLEHMNEMNKRKKIIFELLFIKSFFLSQECNSLISEWDRVIENKRKIKKLYVLLSELKTGEVFLLHPHNETGLLESSCNSHT